VADRNAAGVPIVFRSGARATRAQALAALKRHLIDLRADLPNARGAGYDQRTGEVVLLVTPEDAKRFGLNAIQARAEQVGGVPVRVMVNELDESNMSVDGGGRVEGTNLQTGRRNLCTTAFVVTNGETDAITTAAHCPDDLTYVDRDGSTIELPMIGSWGAAYRDVQINGSANSPDPLFYSNRGAGTLRRVVTWRNVASTRAGDFVCHYGESSGYSCSVVELTDYAPPGDCAAAPALPHGSPFAGRAACRAIAADQCSAVRLRSGSPRASTERGGAACFIIICRQTIFQRAGGCSSPATLSRQVTPELIRTGYRLGGVVPDLHHPVRLIDMDHRRFERPRFSVTEHAVAHDDDEVVRTHEMGSSAVDADHAAPSRTGDHVGFDPGAVRDVDDRDLLAL
jgi:hypothetical protein